MTSFRLILTYRSSEIQPEFQQREPFRSHRPLVLLRLISTTREYTESRPDHLIDRLQDVHFALGAGDAFRARAPER